jgi:putative cardiolipin synthase
MSAMPMMGTMVAGQMHIEWAVAQLVFDDPQKVTRPIDEGSSQLWPRLVRAMGTPMSSLDIVSPYFVPGHQGTVALSALAQRNVRVRVLTNSLASTDISAVHAGYAGRRVPLLKAGVRLYELKPEEVGVVRHHGNDRSRSGGGLHAKTIGVDERRIFVGSLNFDPRSSALNTEMGLIVDSVALTGYLSTFLAQVAPDHAFEMALSPEGRLLWLDGSDTPMDEEPQTSLGRRLWVTFLSWFSIEWLL